MNNAPLGFISILLIVTLGALLSLTTLAAMQLAQNKTAGLIDLEASTKAAEVARACADEAHFHLAVDWSYGGNQTLTVTGNTCIIEPVTTLGSGNKQVDVRSTVGRSTRRFQLEFAPGPVRIVSTTVQ
jgi:hypothetical protein